MTEKIFVVIAETSNSKPTQIKLYADFPHDVLAIFRNGKVDVKGNVDGKVLQILQQAGTMWEEDYWKEDYYAWTGKYTADFLRAAGYKARAVRND